MILKILAAMWFMDLPLVWTAYKHPMELEHAKESLYREAQDGAVDRGAGIYIPQLRLTPDFRLPQYRLEPYGKNEWYVESNRPFRMSPHFQQAQKMKHMGAVRYGCYCTTVYRRFRLLAGCAVLTHRHILTSAAATELVLRKHRKAPGLDGILGFWYDRSHAGTNTSAYGEPARIAYHPRFTMPHRVNRTHPFPVMFDFAVYSTTYPLHQQTYYCHRAAPYKSDLNPNVISSGNNFHVFGFQFMKGYKRVPKPWFKYMVKLEWWTDREYPCPKTEWGWFRCIRTFNWAPLGLDIGAALHRQTKTRSYYSGLIGLNVITMQLRSFQDISYFNDANVHPVLDFLYDAYNGNTAPVYLDKRYADTRGGPPKLKPGAKGPKNYKQDPEQKYSNVYCCYMEDWRPEFTKKNK